MGRKNVSVSIYSRAYYDAEWPPENLMDFHAWLVEKIKAIPEQYRKKAVIDIDPGDSGYAHISITYMRPETNDERLMRNKQESKWAAQTRADELALLRRLKEKYEAAS